MLTSEGQTLRAGTGFLQQRQCCPADLVLEIFIAGEAKPLEVRVLLKREGCAEPPWAAIPVLTLLLAAASSVASVQHAKVFQSRCTVCTSSHCCSTKHIETYKQLGATCELRASGKGAGMQVKKKNMHIP